MQRYQRQIRYLLTAFCAWLCLVGTAIAHTNGGTHEVTIDEYFIDIGYQPEFPDTAGLTRFDFSLFSATSTEDIVYTDVWVTVTRGETTIFSGSISNPRIGPTGFSTLLTTPGVYTIAARFLNDTTTVTETTFTLPVAAGSSTAPDRYPLGLLLISAVAGLLLGLSCWYGWRRTHNNSDHTSG